MKRYFSLVALVFILCTLAVYSATIDLQSISQPASVHFHGTTQGLDTLSDGTTRRHYNQLELRSMTHSFTLEISDGQDDSNTPITAPDYEEVIHDIEKGTFSRPHLDIVRSGNRDDETASLTRCLYSGRVQGHPGSIVSLSTCNGHITGMIKLPDGRLFSIEPDSITTTTVSKGGVASQSTSNAYLQPLSSLRTLARQGDLKSLSESIPSVRLVDAIAEGKWEMDRELKEQKQWNANTLSSDDNDLSTFSADHGNCAMDATVHHPPVSALRKMGLDERSIRRFIKSNNLNEEVAQAAPVTALSDDDVDFEKEAASGPRYPNRFVEIVIYHDRARLNSYNKTGDKSQDEVLAQAREDAILVFNNIRAYYRESGFAHQVECVLKGHVFFAAGDPYTKYLARDGGTMVISNYGLLENFNRYRSRYGHTNHDIGVLLSGNRFQSNIKGVANVGSLCGSARYNGNINSVTYRNIVLNSVLTAHECGHVLSAQHDGRAGHIMHPYVSSDTSFSPGSIRSIDNHLSQTRCTINNPNASTALHPSAGVLESLSTAVFGGGRPQKSYIYTQNTEDMDQFDYVHPELVRQGPLNTHLVDVSDRTALIQAQQRELEDRSRLLAASAQANDVVLDTHTADSLKPIGYSTAGLTTAQLLTALGLTALGCCALTAASMCGMLWWISRNKDVQNLVLGQKSIAATGLATPPHHNGTTANANIPTDSRYNFTPRLRPKGLPGFDVNVAPDTPRESNPPASPSYSESVRHRGRSDSREEEGIIFEEHDPTIEDISNLNPAHNRTTSK